jgi:hypothetical protein
MVKAGAGRARIPRYARSRAEDVVRSSLQQPRVSGLTSLAAAAAPARTSQASAGVRAVRRGGRGARSGGHGVARGVWPRRGGAGSGSADVRRRFYAEGLGGSNPAFCAGAPRSAASSSAGSRIRARERLRRPRRGPSRGSHESSPRGSSSRFAGASMPRAGRRRLRGSSGPSSRPSRGRAFGGSSSAWRRHARVLAAAGAWQVRNPSTCDGVSTRRGLGGSYPRSARGPPPRSAPSSATSSRNRAPIARASPASPRSPRRLARVEPAREFTPVVAGALGPACRRERRVPRTSPLLRGERSPRSSRPLARLEPVGAGGARGRVPAGSATRASRLRIPGSIRVI